MNSAGGVIFATMNNMTRLRKSLLITAGIIVGLVILVILFISPITKYAIEKYDEEYTGRKITLSLAYVNPFTGYIYLRNLKLFEYKSDSVFFSAKGISVNIGIWKLLSKTYVISDFTMNEPYGIVIQNKDRSNFDDLLKKFTQTSDTLSEPAHFEIGDINIKNGEFHYVENEIPINYFIRKVNVSSEGMSWDSDSVSAEFDFLSGVSSGEIKGNITANMTAKRYRLAVKIDKFDMNLIEQYMKDLTNYGTLRATVDADLLTNGSYEDTEDITMSGTMAVNGFHFGKNPRVDYASFDQLIIAMTEISPKKYIFHGDSLILKHPYFKYEKYDSLDNLETMFGKDGQNIDAVKADSAKFNLIIEMAEYVKKLSKYFFKSHYRINRLAITDADIRYNDYSMSEKFSMDFNPLSIKADSIDKNHPWVYLTVNSGIKPYGDFEAQVTINPKDSSDFDMNYNIQKLPLSMLNPYTIMYASYPFDRGTIEFNGKWHVRNGKIESVNHLVVIDPRITKRLHNKEIKFIPMRPVMALVREQGNVIDYEIPITGNLDDPKFHIGDIIWDIVSNIFVKPVKTGYRIQVKEVETEIEKSLSLKWPMRSSELLPDQEQFIEKMTQFLKENPNATISVYPQLFEQKEREYTLFFEAKKKYYLLKEKKSEEAFDEMDSVKVEKMSVKDEDFVKYADKQLKDSLKFTIQEKCLAVVDSNRVNMKLKQLNEIRKNVFIKYFVENGVDKQLVIHKEHSIVPFNGFSFFKINYQGELPTALLKAYDKMEELNSEPPRKKFKKDRETTIPPPEVNPNTR